MLINSYFYAMFAFYFWQGIGHGNYSASDRWGNTSPER